MATVRTYIRESHTIKINPTKQPPTPPTPTAVSARDVIMSDAMRMSHQPTQANAVKQTEPSINKTK